MFFPSQGDIKLMSDTGLEAYRLSISWPRLLPNGRGVVNPKGLKYYNNVIDELIKHGIQPHVTLHHLDIPQVLQDEYGGWLRTKIIDDFQELADVCFKEFGDRVSYWTTMNEPNINSLASFDYGFFPPRRCSHPYGANCSGGNSTIEPYITVHNYILAHSAAAELYRKKYQTIQKGQIGINIYSIWFTPLTNSTEDAMATKRALDFILGWILNPILFGEYLDSMKKNAGSRLPSFTYFESERVKGSDDFIGINYYFALYVADDPVIDKTIPRDSSSDKFAKFTAYKNVPPVSYGLGVVDTMNDVGRTYFLSGFIRSVLDSIRDGVDVRGYFIWTFVDAFELLSGYSTRFGLYHVNFEDSGHERTPKFSAYWYHNFLKNGSSIKIENNSKQWEHAPSE
ncbi:hypothetical protein KFK09_014225 [Dendrobium nobile]|uniref:Uncharacterized protein n=1 Tax=Dendrobium nobile TaxID=94219 RepID=A0A8T3BBG2_DENNO|nr:hypothetical protein KFK09_014225 [Dendrobium nobile]